MGTAMVARRQPLNNCSLPGKSNIAKINRQTYNNTRMAMQMIAIICLIFFFMIRNLSGGIV